MNPRPVTEPGMSVAPAAAIASLTGGAVLSAVLCWHNGQFSFRTFVGTAILAGFIGLLIAGLVTPSIAKWTVRDQPLRWSNAALTGMLTPSLPALLFLLISRPVLFGQDGPWPIGGWIVGVATLAFAGASAGLVFRALHGERQIAPR